VGLSASGPDGLQAHQTAGFAISYPPDYADTRPNEALLMSLAEQTGGKVLTDPAQAFARPETLPRSPLDIWRVLLWIAAVLLPIDVAIRRLVIGPEDVEPLLRPLRAFLARRPRAHPTSPPETVGRLLERRRRHEAGDHPVSGTPAAAEPDAPPQLEDAPPPEPINPPSPADPPSSAQTGQDTTARLLDSRRRRQQDREG
jgi:hypothetical protein